MAADKRQYAVGGNANAKRAAGRQYGFLDATGDQRVLNLKVGDRMNGGRPADRLRSDLRKPNMADITSLHHFRDGSDRVLDRHVRIEPCRAVDVDIIGAEALQRALSHYQIEHVTNLLAC